MEQVNQIMDAFLESQEIFTSADLHVQFPVYLPFPFVSLIVFSNYYFGAG